MNVKGKRLLILGAGRGQIGLYKAAREMGVVSIRERCRTMVPLAYPWLMRCAI